MKIIFISTILSCVLLSSCAFLLGVSDPKSLSDEEINLYISKKHIDHNYKIDSDTFLKIYEQLDDDQLDDLYQPLQLIVFNKDQENICHLINCNIGGIPLKWNKYGSFNEVPVLPKEISEPEYKVSFEEMTRIVSPYGSATPIDIQLFESYDYVYFIYYCKSLGSFTNSYLKIIDYYKQSHPDAKIKYIYLLTDNHMSRLSHIETKSD